jgi:hypothetical protein
MANAKRVKKYQSMIIKLHLQGVTYPSEILGALLNSYTLSGSKKAQKLSAPFRKRRLLDEVQTLLETQTLDSNNLKTFIVTFDKTLSQAKWKLIFAN